MTDANGGPVTRPGPFILDHHDKREVFVPFSTSLLADSGMDIGAHINRVIFRGLDVQMHPWKAANRNPFPEFVPFPRVERARLRYLAERKRLADVRHVWRYGMPDTDY